MDLTASVYAGNLPFDATSEMLEKAFSVVAPVEEIKIARNVNGLFMGYAFVRMRSASDVAKIVAALNGKEISGREVYLTPGSEQEDLWERAFFD